MVQYISLKELEKRKKRAQKIIRELKKLFPQTKIALKYSSNWELLVAVILSAQCTDKKVNEVVQKLFKKYKILDDYVHADLHEFEQDIRSTGFYRNKAKNILASAQIIKQTYHGRIPKTMEEALKLPGVARKTANVVLGNAYGIVEGIAVDTHVKRLSKLYGLTNETNPDKIEKDLMQIIPKKEWFAFTYRMIDYGRKYCPARPHDHAHCPLVKIK
ncbi:endonuclease III [Patescibacteria group bacterium AH-259-L05]|nr:endonuclease III [Patescibacteria group bacterium AH-259-L05]